MRGAIRKITDSIRARRAKAKSRRAAASKGRKFSRRKFLGMVIPTATLAWTLTSCATLRGPKTYAALRPKIGKSGEKTPAEGDWHAQLRKIEGEYAPVFRANYAKHEKQLKKFIEVNYRTFWKAAKGVEYEKGGFMYVQDGKIGFRWVEDPSDKIYFTVADQLRKVHKTGDLTKIKIKDLDRLIQDLKRDVEFLPEEEALWGRYNWLKKFVLRKRRTGPLSGEELKDFKYEINKMAKFLEKEAKYSYSEKAVMDAINFESGGEGKVLCTFHTHPTVTGVSPTDLDYSIRIPEVTFNMEKTGGMNVTFLVGGIVADALQFSTIR